MIRILKRALAGAKLGRQARRLKQEAESRPELPVLLDLILTHPKFPAQQKRKEFLGLLELLKPLKPARILEIGSENGGSLFLFCQVAPPGARLLSVDLNIPAERRRAHPLFARPGRRVACLKADSHSPETLRRVNQWLGGEPLDFLFIDGDHSFAGVSRDYELYFPLLRKGGLAAFHDILPDFKTRYGKKTGAYTGEVYRFWKELKNREPRALELIEDPEQDGFGIGVVIK